MFVPSGAQDEGASAPRVCSSHGKSMEFQGKQIARAHLCPLSVLSALSPLAKMSHGAEPDVGGEGRGEE